MNPSFLYALFILVFAVPALWSLALDLARKAGARGLLTHTLNDRFEKILLTLMVLPAITGAIALALSQWAPLWMTYQPSILPPFVDIFASPGDSISAKPSLFPQGAETASGALMILLAVYGAGAGVSIARLVRAWLQIRKLEDSAVRQALISGREISVTPAMISPFITMQGRIIFPQSLLDQLGAPQLNLVIHHEEAHFQRGDPGYFWLLAWFDIIFWFNPVIRKQTKNCRLAAELACDQAVLMARPAKRKLYAQTMLATLRIAGNHPPLAGLPACVPAIFSQPSTGDFKMRLHQIMHSINRREKNHRPLAVAGLCALSVIAVPVMLAQFSLAHGSNSMGANNLDDGQPKTIFTVTPLTGKISSRYGQRHDPFTGKERFHRGIDIIADTGTRIVAPGSGIVTGASYHEGYGNLLQIDHGNGYVTRYGQLSAFDVREGEAVRAGQTIARVGSTGRSTGPHLHLELWKEGQSIDPQSLLSSGN